MHLLLVALCIVWVLRPALRLLLSPLPPEAVLSVAMACKPEIVAGIDGTELVRRVHIVRRMRHRHIDAW